MTEPAPDMDRLRGDGRRAGQCRPLILTPGFITHAEGSVLVECGGTRVICTASVEDKVPPFLRGTGRGWVTAEYGMLPRATHTRSTREAKSGKQGGRTLEIQRLIGRSLRASVDLSLLGEHTVLIDCDVIEADGGTRTAAITGGFVCLVLALRSLNLDESRRKRLIQGHVAAVSVGLVGDRALLDLNYEEDSSADVDLNVVMLDSGLVEIQGTAEGAPFTRAQLDTMVDLAEKGIASHMAIQREALGGEPLP